MARNEDQPRAFPRRPSLILAQNTTKNTISSSSFNCYTEASLIFDIHLTGRVNPDWEIATGENTERAHPPHPGRAFCLFNCCFRLETLETALPTCPT
jgi:hypothetical protein